MIIGDDTEPADWSDGEVNDPTVAPCVGTGVRTGEQLTEDQRARLMALVSDYPDVFSDRLGYTDIAEHRIVVSDETPCYQASYRVPESLSDQVQQELAEMERSGVRKYDPLATWNSPMIIVRKSNGGIRIVNNFIQLNKRTIAEPYIMTNSMELLNRVAGSKYITKLDCRQAYFQIGLEEQSRKYTSFQTPFGTYSYLKMPIGLVGASSTLQRIMDIMLRNAHRFSDKLLDDVIVWTNDFDDHLKRLDNVLARFRRAGLTLNVSKCHLATDRIQIFGFQVDKGLIMPDDEKTRAVSEFPTPKTKKQLASFVGLVGYFRGHIANFAEIAFPLTELLARHQPDRLRWTDVHQGAFDKLKKALISKPVLCPPDMSKDFELWTDSSKTTLSAVLMQRGEEGDDTPRVVSYASRKLLPREMNYSTVDRETLSVVFGVTKFRHFVFGKKIHVKNDHRALTYLNSMVKASSRLAKWALILQGYDLEIQYVPGSQQLADAFTRLE